MITKNWADETVAVVATGPSLSVHDAILLEEHSILTIAVNDSWKRCPTAAILYAADERWWKHHEFVPLFKGEKWTQQQGSITWEAEAVENGLQVIRSKNKPGISIDPAVIHTGFNSGFQALNIAVLKGAQRILLLGMDCTILNGSRHWFGDHPVKLNKASPYSVFINAFTQAAPQLEQLGVEVINCSEHSAIKCFKHKPLLEMLG